MSARKKPHRTKATDEANGVQPRPKGAWGGAGRLRGADREALDRKTFDAEQIAYGTDRGPRHRNFGKGNGETEGRE